MGMLGLVDLKEGDFLQIGGKADNLRRLIHAGFNVPSKGFVLTVDDLKNWENIRDLAVSKFEEIFAGVDVAVRSSAVCEDSKSVSWAGQFKTSLFVSGKINFLLAVDSFVSALNDHGIMAYKKAVNGNQQNNVGVALVIQEMIDAEISGVLFTVNPLNGKRDEMIVNSILGVGEQLVSGIVNGDTYVIGPGGKAKKIKLQEDNKRTLDDDLIYSLFMIGKKIEEVFGCLQDIEWAIVDGVIYILQSRPITAISHYEENCQRIVGVLQKNWESERARLAGLGIFFEADCYSDQNIAELLTSHPTPMSFGGFCYMFADGEAGIRLGRSQMGYAIDEELDIGFFTMVGGQPRCSIIHDALTYRIEGIPLEDYAILVQNYLEKIRQNSDLANYPEVVLYNQDPSYEFLSSLFGEEKAKQYRMAYNRFFVGLALLIESTALEMKTFEIDFRKHIARQRLVVDLLDGDLQRNIVLCMELFGHLRSVACVMFVKVARLGFFAYARLRDRLVANFGQQKGEQFLAVLTSGLENDPSLQFNVFLAGYRDGTISFDELLERYGHLGGNELEISGPRYHENPAVLIHYAKQISGDPINDLRRRKRECDEVRLSLNQQLGNEIVNLIGIARQYLAGRELIKYLYLMEYDLVRQVLMKIEVILRWEDGLIFFLYPEEITRLQFESEDLHEVAMMRRRDQKDFMNVCIPPVLFTDQLELIGCFSYDSNSKILKGMGVTDQVVTGRVVLVRDPCNKSEVEKLFAGCVLVTMTTDPSWAPLIAAIGREGGLVTEIGGPLAHGAIVARELGIAAVLNVSNAMQILKDGMIIEVNGPAGVVRILD